MRSIFLILGVFCLLNAGAQLSGTKTIPGDYPDLASAVTALNAQGVGSGGVVFQVMANQVTNGPLLISRSGTAAAPIVFRGNGSVVSSTGTASSADGVFVLAGADYVTIDSFELVGDVAVEYGVALLKRNATAPYDGCWHNTIRANHIRLDQSGGRTSGIYAAHHLASGNSTLPLTNYLVSDANNYNQVTGNNIIAYHGIQFFGQLLAWRDEDNRFENNYINNYGGGAQVAYGIRQEGHFTLTISGNRVSLPFGNSVTAYGIFEASANGDSVRITGNSVSMGAMFNTASALLVGIQCSSTSAYLSVANNSIYSCSYSNSASGGAFYGFRNSGNPARLVLSGNSLFSNSSNNGTMVLLAAGQADSLLVTGNNLYSNTRTANTGQFFGITAASTTYLNASDNQVSDLTTGASGNTSATELYGIYNEANSGTEIYRNNRITGLYIQGANSGAVGATLCGIWTNTSTSATKEFSGNKIGDLRCSVRGMVYGVRQRQGQEVRFFSNKFYDLWAGYGLSRAIGIEIASGSSVTIANNIVGGLQASGSTYDNAVIGIDIGTSTFARLYFNTVSLNAVAGASSTFGSYAVYATGGNFLTLKNNLLTNTSQSAGAGAAVAFGRTTTALSVYQDSSDYNLFYAGTPGAANLLYKDAGASAQTLAQYKTLVGPVRDAHSLSANVLFSSTTGTQADFLHIDAASLPPVSNKGTPVAGILTDFDGDTRMALTPDIGADEFQEVLAVGSVNEDISSFRLLPNRVAQDAVLQLRLLRPAAYTFQVVDAQGRPVLQWKENLPAGLSSRNYSLQALPAGTYVLQGSSKGSAPVAVRFVKL
ncbi:MAG: hypothetical protein EOO16_19500 [Chitinophagaceae bacterium]|nr:MAG: hypothetical protein EOO16_19500 [Chitinophagaceae bacterium]